MDDEGQIDPNHPDCGCSMAVAGLICKAEAGTRLFFALYHHPDAAKVVGALCESLGFTKAWMQAGQVFLPDFGNVDGDGQVNHTYPQ